MQVVFDGHCGICTAAMVRLVEMYGTRIEPVDFRSYGDVSEIHPSLREDACKARMHVIRDGRVYGGAEAAVQLMQLHKFYRWPTKLYYVPPIGWLSERLYDWVSRNRFKLSKLFGLKVPACTDACSVHPPSPSKSKSKQKRD
ncbi:thiol-disulfide oxidoreductase DCC family protein [Tumebacillus flagellatus]|uniref:Thiol-disulfide oxidoreductase n=1 Tax=Tumebacillus flagellatus TaxID=1157490 RepID=A0A074LKW2_9BACL|nr:DUF393 domain-containing protein [Tumebacillus flagellatus]KEO81185.1 hypothetical protein EL26_22275 [Tumebacillus flagellatus]